MSDPKRDDEALALELFLGRMTSSKSGRLRREYLSPNSQRERLAIKALCKQLNQFFRLAPDRLSPIASMVLHEMLVALNPDGDGARRLTFKSRKGGRQSDLTADFQVFSYVTSRRAERVKNEAIIQEVKDRFRLSKKGMYDAINGLESITRNVARVSD